MKITSILTSKNRKYETRRALDSIFAQTRKSDEVILVLDYCEDGTEEYLSSLDYPDLHVISVPAADKTGPGYVRNLGLKKATGDYIAFLDSDDIWHPTKLAAFEEHIKKNPSADIVFSDAYFHNNGSCHIIPFLKTQDQSRLLQIAYSRNICFASASMYRKGLFAEIGLFDEQVASLCDWEFAIRCLSRHNQTFSYLPTPLTDIWVMYNSACFDAVAWKAEYEKMLYSNKIRIASDGTAGDGYQAYELFFSAHTSKDGLINDFITVLGANSSVVRQILEKKQSEIETLHEELNRRQSFYTLMRSWTKLYQSGKTLSDILRTHGITKVAVYGYGIHGRMLLNDLRKGNIEVTHIIDNKVQEAPKGIPLFHLGQEMPPVNVLILTPYLEREQITTKLETKLAGRIIDLNQLVNDSF